MTAVSFLRGAKNAANSTVLPGSGPHHVNYYIEQYSSSATRANVHSAMQFFPDLFAVGAKAGLSATNILICQSSAVAKPSSGALTVTVRAEASDTDCITSPEASFKFEGVSSSDRFGNYVASGDLNGDGVDDLIVSAHDANSVYVFYGGASFVGVDLASVAASAKFTGASSGDLFGGSVATGDLNGDGVADLIVGATAVSSSAGAVYVFYGGTSFASLGVGSASATFTGASASDKFGLSVASGDVNGDGVADLIVGADGANSVYVFYGGTGFTSLAAGSASATFTGAGKFGYSVASGDLNGDRVADLIVGANEVGSSAGAAYVFYGGTSFSSLAAASASATFTGAVADDLFGGSVATGDLNGDGTEDLIVAAYRNDDVEINSGAVYVFYGGTSFSSLAAASASATFTGAAASDEFGYSVASGDLNGDEVEDLIVGAQPNAIEVHVFYGGSSFTGVAAGSDGVVTFSGTAAAAYAPAIASGDFNGDLVADLVLGPNNLSTDPGVAHVVLGSAGLTDITFA